MTKNITLAIDDDLLDKARVLAAMRRTSVNEMVRGFLQHEVDRESTQAGRAEVWGRLFEAVDKDVDSREPRSAGEGRLFDREEFYGEVMRERRLL
ncbi:hypothetical protein [Hoeflea sp.]|uniref:hypothetical protein n=1 Tax=Hoeflea sp. TaxID=1940281 RepID=UPI00199B170A|nr:hypothetical protein [Hoeflea sp.]MBC7280854.1 hypothetical protein [Hoeflea sp.]